jgi:hypothetical protein
LISAAEHDFEGQVVGGWLAVYKDEVDVEPSHGFSLPGQYAIGMNPADPDADALQSWLAEVDRLELLENDELSLLLALIAEASWREAILEHMGECKVAQLEREGNSRQQCLTTRRQQLLGEDVDRCMEAALAVTGAVGLAAGTIAACVAPDATVTKVACVAGIGGILPASYLSVDKSYECVCGGGEPDFLGACPELTCQLSTCRAKCAGPEGNGSMGATKVRGTCQDVREGFKITGDEQRCVCAIVIDDSASICECESGCSNGDPHVLSLDGLRFGFHGVGEYVLVEAVEGPELTVGDNTNNGSTEDDIITRDGEVLEQPVYWDEFYDRFGESWRISVEESLFDYASGEDTSEHTLSSYPSRPVSLDELSDASLEVIKPLFLDGWMQQSNASAGNWVVQADGRSVTQTSNGDPTFFVSTGDYFGVTIRGTFEVSTTGDDDYIGFVFGYRSPLEEAGDAVDDFDTFVLSWKQTEQSSGSALSEEGLTLAHASGVIDDIIPSFWGQQDTPAYTVFATDSGENRGWEDNTQHTVQLEYNAERIRVWIDGTLIFDVSQQDANVSFEPGRFGFYNYSQDNVIYSNFSVLED